MASPQTEAGYLKIANELWNQIMMTQFRLYDRNILDLILRLSYGCGKKWATIPRQRDFTICGLAEQKVKAALERLERAGVIVWDRPAKRFAINKDYERWRIDICNGYNEDRLKELVRLNLDPNFTSGEEVAAAQDFTPGEDLRHVPPEQNFTSSEVAGAEAFTSGEVFASEDFTSGEDLGLAAPPNFTSGEDGTSPQVKTTFTSGEDRPPQDALPEADSGVRKTVKDKLKKTARAAVELEPRGDPLDSVFAVWESHFGARENPGDVCRAIDQARGLGLDDEAIIQAIEETAAGKPSRSATGYFARVCGRYAATGILTGQAARKDRELAKTRDGPPGALYDADAVTAALDAELGKECERDEPG